MIARSLFIVGITLSTCALAAAPQREFSVDLWDWTVPCRDLPTFKIWVADLKRIGATRIEISAPWSLLEPTPGVHDLSFIADRLAVAKALGLGMRVRINSFYYGATPTWYDGAFWQDVDGKPPMGIPIPPSIVDERFWSRFGPLCTKIAQQFKGEDISYNAFIGVHAELKFADWWSYDPPALAAWRQAIRDRPQWLKDVAGDAVLPDKPPVPQPTRGTPDNLPQSKAWIAFREHIWREAMIRFNTAIRAGDADAKTTVPLGESFRRESAAFSNLDYHGLSRGAQQVVHSYDFFWHTKDDAWMAAAAVASFLGIMNIEDIAFEFDGPYLIQNLDYDQPHQLRIADAALAQGAGLKAANYSGDPRLPSTWPVLVEFGKRAATTQPFVRPPPEKTILLFISKWANYCYRENTEWLHDAQFGAWHMLTSRGFPVRIICEDNLEENLANYRGLYVAFSPPELIPERSRERLKKLSGTLRSVVELSRIPDASPQPTRGQTPPMPGSDDVLDYPLGYQWLRGDREMNDRLFAEVSRIWKTQGDADPK